MIEYSDFNLLIRELGNGVWAVLCFSLVIALAYWGGRRFSWRMYRSGHSDPAICASFALSLYFFGSGLRALTQWGTIMSAALGWDNTHWTDLWPLFVLALTCAVVGGIWCVWAVAPRRWRLKAASIVSLLAFTIPLLAYWGVRQYA